ncbi:hypothetical protein GCM10008940_26260 [Microbulbifer agarilyticus]
MEERLLVGTPIMELPQSNDWDRPSQIIQKKKTGDELLPAHRRPTTRKILRLNLSGVRLSSTRG